MNEEISSELTVMETDLSKTFHLLAKGKVRELFEIDDTTLLMVATDRISAFDRVLKNGIPDKGKLLTLMTSHWLSVLSAAHPGLRTHFLSLSIPAAVPENLRSKLQNRCMQVRRFDIFPIEAIVRGYLTGSAYREYREKGTVHGIKVAAGLQESEQFPSGPLYTPSTKAEAGKHDDNIHPSEAAKIVGHDYAERIQKLSLSLYETARKYAMERGIIIADTKFEFGLDRQTDEIVLVDEVITPDSSRFWPAASYEVGRSQESYDKQYLRDWLTDQGLKKKKTVDDGVMMPVDVVCRTQEKYIEAFERITGKKWVDAEVKYTYVSTT